MAGHLAWLTVLLYKEKGKTTFETLGRVITFETKLFVGYVLNF